jgi:hypothetical protein
MREWWSIRNCYVIVSAAIRLASESDGEVEGPDSFNCPIEKALIPPSA